MRKKYCSLPAYVYRVATASSIFLNCILGGYSNQTFSARNWELKIKKLPNAVWLIDAIFFKELNHCKEAYIKWQIIKQAIDSYDMEN